MNIKLTPTPKVDLDKLLEDTPTPATADNSRGKYIVGYQKEHYDLMRINLPKGMKARIQAEAQSRGVSATKLMLQIIQDFLDKEC